MDWLRPKKNFKQVIEEYGYPFISKEVSECVDGARRYVKALTDRQTDRQTDSAVQCVHGGFVGNRQKNRQGKRTVSKLEEGDYP